MSSPRLHLQAGLHPIPVSHARWDPDSFTFSCTLEKTGKTVAAPSLRERVDALLQVRAPERRATLGDIDILLDEQSRPTSIEFYGNPTRWTPVDSQAEGSQEVSDVSLELDYDVNGIASVDVPVSIEHDAPRRTLIVRFGEVVARWVTFAEGLSVGMSKDRRLAAFRFQPFELET